MTMLCLTLDRLHVTEPQRQTFPQESSYLRFWHSGNPLALARQLLGSLRNANKLVYISNKVSMFMFMFYEVLNQRVLEPD